MENKNQLSDSFLDELFQEAKLDSPAISIEEIRDLVQAEPILNKKFGARNWYLIIASFLLFGLFFLSYFQSRDKDEQSPTIEQKEEQKPSINNPTDSVIEESISLVSSLPKPLIPLPKMQNRIRFEPKPGYPEEPWPLIYPSYTPKENSDELILSYQELAALHIYSDGCELRYTNLSDSLYTNKGVLRKRQNRIFYFTEIQSYGGSYTLNNSVLASDSMMAILSDSFLLAYPMFIEKEITFLEKKSTSQNVGDVTTDILELKAPLMVAQDFVTEAKKLLVPVRVELKAKANMYGRTDYDMVFWFKPTQKFCDLLPINKANWVRQNYANYTDENYNELIKRLIKNKLLRKENLKMDSVIFQTDLSKALLLNEKQLKQLGIRENRKGEIQYKVCYKKKLIEVYRLESQFPPSFNFIGGYGFIGFLKGVNKNFQAHFLTDEGAQFYMLNKENSSIHSLERYDENYQNRQKFKEEKAKLVPVLVKCRRPDGTIVKWYFWFLNSPEFRAAIK
ncbi:MAG: hypothetical protein K9J84_03800 [Bacteroidia bacterium]|nr:hypothetical protein [Bacteroidia bacterium]